MAVLQTDADASCDEISTVNVADQVVGRLRIAILLMVALILLGVVYVFVSGVIAPTGPRTALEARLLLSEDAVIRNPESGEARFDFIVSAAAVGRDAKALEAAEVAKKQLKGLQLPYAYLAEASVHFGNGDYAKALSVLDAGIVVNDKVAADVAAEYAKKKIDIKPEELAKTTGVRLLMLKAQSLARLDRPEDSLQALSAALSADPQAADILSLRAATYAQLGRLDEARADYRQALKFVPDYPQALSGLESLGN